MPKARQNLSSFNLIATSGTGSDPCNCGKPESLRVPVLIIDSNMRCQADFIICQTDSWSTGAQGRSNAAQNGPSDSAKSERRIATDPPLTNCQMPTSARGH